MIEAKRLCNCFVVWGGQKFGNKAPYFSPEKVEK